MKKLNCKNWNYRFNEEATVKCKCGHTLNFLKPYAQKCSWCGRLAFPTKKVEFYYGVYRKMGKKVKYGFSQPNK